MRLPSRLRRAVVAVAVSTAAVGGLAVATASPASAAACAGTTGVTVVVDFGSLGGGVKTMCAPGDPTSGLTALTGAGYTYAFAPRFPGFVCQINVKPNPCNGGPATAYWSYWHAPRHGAWTYSTSGAGSYNPKPNTVEGWAFGAGIKPSITPP
jgi:hypothetical protein